MTSYTPPPSAGSSLPAGGYRSPHAAPIPTAAGVPVLQPAPPVPSGVAHVASYAHPGRRLVARLIDSTLVFLVVTAVALLGYALVGAPVMVNPVGDGTLLPTTALLVSLVAYGAALFVAYALYETVLTARSGQTLGKRMMGVRVVTDDGQLLGFGRSLGRFLVYYVFAGITVVQLIDPLWMLWDPQRQTLHDKVVGTLVTS